ncbi:MAG: hypothetical protein IM638_17775 [Bacteroidetes bacterium]|nr:hypothetical protein [Bacteroidota bacterium]
MRTSRLLLFLFILAGTLAFAEADAQPGPRGNRGPRANRPAARRAEKVHARRVIRRTAAVILVAQKKVKENKVYTGNLARSIAHQRYARRLYLQGRYLRAMHHSRRARQLAILAIKANNGTETADMTYNKEDEEIMNAEPVSDKELDDELDKDMPNQPTKDEDFVDAVLTEIDVSDLE